MESMSLDYSSDTLSNAYGSSQHAEDDASDHPSTPREQVEITGYTSRGFYFVSVDRHGVHSHGFATYNAINPLLMRVSYVINDCPRRTRVLKYIDTIDTNEITDDDEDETAESVRATPYHEVIDHETSISSCMEESNNSTFSMHENRDVATV